ncbi:hypothetical protein [Zavarzinella formosa]|uniref:hypothetical protein n=1 Tax=Zavarzinella formosa TaxID=360055 RepID=UPI0012F8C996|nr:hypothetical protein [Zavarzinella formosa]
MFNRFVPVIGLSAVLAALSHAQEPITQLPVTNLLSAAQEPKKEIVDPKQPLVDPKTPKVDPKTPKVDPKTPPPTTNPPIVDLLAEGGNGTTADPSRTGQSITYAPNMYGDAFGGGRTRFNVFLGSLQAQSRVIDNTLSDVPSSPNRPLSVNYGPGAGNGIVVVGNATQAKMLGLSTTPGVKTYQLASYPNASPQFTSVENYKAIQTRILAQQVQNGGGKATFAITDNAAYHSAADGIFNKLYGPGSTAFVSQGSKVVYTTPVLNEGASFSPGVADIFYKYDAYSQIDVATPASGGVVGRTKISEENNPLPRDRIIFGYDFFNNTRLTTDGFNVQRFSPGFETTFLDQQASIQVQLPFAATLNPVSATDGGVSNRDTVFGNMFVTLKGLFYSSQTFHAATGLGLALPTSPDTVLKLPGGGGDLLRIKNESLDVVPFLAGIYTPNSRFFWQNWLSMSFDTTGSPVLANLDGNGLRPIGRLRDQSVMALDTQIGYWLIVPGTGEGFVRGLTPFLELHYNSTVTNSPVVQSGGFGIASSDNRYDELNLSTGLAMYLENNLLVSTSLVVPLKSGPDKFFDYQLGFRVSWFFGATAANPSALQYGR